MTLGPVEYLLIGFPGNQFTGEIAPALADLVDAGTIRILDLVFVRKDTGGTISALEYDALSDAPEVAALDGEAGGLLTDEDVAYAAEALDPDSSAAPPPAPAVPPAPPADPIAQLKDLAALKDQGVLTDQEFATQKARILGS